MLLYQANNSMESGHFHYDFYDDFYYIPHFHEYYEITIVLEGEVIVQTGTDEERIRAHDMAFILPNQIHAYRTPASSKALVALFSTDLVNTFYAETKGRAPDRTVFTCDAPVFQYICNTILGEPTLYELKSCLYALCGAYARQASFHTVSHDDDLLVRKIMEYIAAHFTENITLKGMAKSLGYHPGYVSRCFNHYVQRNFRSFLNEYRVEYAKSVLVSTAMSVSEVALECGFETIRSFNRAFKTVTGQTPSALRNR